MSSVFNSPFYPIVTWQPDFDDAVNEVVITSGDITASPVTVQITGKNYWGFANETVASTTGSCADNSLAGWLRGQINSNLVAGQTHVSASYSWPTTTSFGVPRTIYTRVDGTAMQLEFKRNGTASTELANVFGFSNSTVNFNTTTGLLNCNFNSDGYWAPYPMYTVGDIRNSIDPVYITENSDGSVIEAIRWGSRKIDRRLTWPIVYAADVFLYRRTNAGFATPAGRDPGDPNNLLENMIIAAGTGSQFRIYSDAGVYRLGYIYNQDNMRDFSSNIEDISARGAMYEVGINFRDLGNDGTGG